METNADHRSFVLKPSTNPDAGVGVFTIRGITKGVHLDLFAPNFEEELVPTDSVPVELQMFCIDQADNMSLCPKYFNQLDIGNYLNHSVPKQNITYKEGEGFFALRNIDKGEELFANYQELGEPKETWEDYYTDGS